MGTLFYVSFHGWERETVTNTVPRRTTYEHQSSRMGKDFKQMRYGDETSKQLRHKQTIKKFAAVITTQSYGNKQTHM
ncbi:hypothetical protein Bca52824_088043 [Brassica carinata]|uniref:Uncharacterized protein n=1 Tax=Brassica carinata TaxID=52824 RepID=A0A8X7TNB3_BRACI|nr:hypothetical protein Bca52824_088043 [Brassica carinata]